MNRKIKFGILFTAGLLMVAGFGLYLGRNALLKHIVKGKIEQIERHHDLRISYACLQMPSVNQVELKDLIIIPHQRDTLLKLNSLIIDLNFWKLLGANISIRQVQTDRLTLSFVKKNSLSNYDFLFKKDSTTTATAEPQRDFAQRVSKTLGLAFELLPNNGTIKNLTISHQSDSAFIAMAIPELTIKDSRFSTEVIVEEDSLKGIWMTRGELNKANRTVKAEIYKGKTDKISLPYIDKYYGAKVTFDSLSYQLTETNKTNGEIALNGEAKISGLNIYHKALSPEVIDLNRGCFNYKVNIGKDFIELDSATNIEFNRLQFHPYIRAEKNKEWHFTFSVNKPSFPADELFSSLPKGLFGNLEGIKTSGKLSYHALLDIDFDLLDSLKFESALISDNFRIESFGKSNLAKMSEEFEYTAYENGRPVRTFAVGLSNPNFAPLDSISPLLQMSVMQSEDGAFYYHNGFLINMMREALIHDLQVKRFARGGSTITMQLVKNVFLNRNKNIARKLEEALIVWLIETQKLTSKERMYEVYLNIAEWGPLIYGAKEASKYYFNKRPSQLTANEAIFLASIIPKPKYFRSSFNPDMTLKENMNGYYNIIANRLVSKGLITEKEAAKIQPEIEVTGEAKEDFVLSKDSMKVKLIERENIKAEEE